MEQNYLRLFARLTSLHKAIKSLSFPSYHAGVATFRYAHLILRNIFRLILKLFFIYVEASFFSKDDILDKKLSKAAVRFNIFFFLLLFNISSLRNPYGKLKISEFTNKGG
ncbi:hypothetical protein [Jeotgalibacillus proteolyticus]|uniref:hypothetical protein n=1 Tax=Jeotgalibacillus proteolyticus TaxID=2082395 RepID=UPI003CECF704